MPAVSVQLDYTSGRVRRLSVRETSGTVAATLRLWDGSNANGVLLDTVALSAGQSTRDYYLDGQYNYYGGLYLQVVSGTFEGLVVVEDLKWETHEPRPVILVNPDVLQLDVTQAAS